ncbi:MFS transporter [Vibrio inusitatus NBRC 102082]|uniref:MFS transporter n=1 Tax=Vibrio inusitatus NBRC 102082 TaxID=1219070 RepID=A0A4Y3HVF7_9VIBR|nr:DUF2955 domain-containing protein [Vibrio inusitatus]GEA50975.1 MFS transporter [Vibrio inusitatus NBRC 102082]
MKAFRIWFACSLGLALSMVLGWNYGFLAIVLPMFVLSNTEHFHLPLLLMIFVSALVTILEFNVMWGVLKNTPLLLTIVVGISFFIKCVAMTDRKTFLLGYMGLIVGSILLNFSSYSFIDIEEFSITILMYCLLNIVICALAYSLFPTANSEYLEKGEGNQQQAPYQNYQLVMMWVLPMIAFVIFQLADLYDSAAAHASILIILAPMTYTGALKMAKVRIIGTGLGCVLGLVMQLTLGLWFESAFLYWLLFTIILGPLCYMQTQGIAKSAISFSATAALTVPMTTALTPGETDAFFALLYRFSSIFIAVVLSALLIFLMQQIAENRSRERLCKS